MKAKYAISNELERHVICVIWKSATKNNNSSLAREMAIRNAEMAVIF